MHITIDGKDVKAYAGETIMDVAKRANVFIPGFCYNVAKEGPHSCRLCMVEIEGEERLIAACAYLVREGLSIITCTERIKRIRKALLRLMYLEAPDNPVILELMKKCDVTKTSLPVKLNTEKGSKGCILCYHCVDACKSLGASAISSISRGVDKSINTPYKQASDACIGCASCAEACPINAIQICDTEEGRKISNKEFKWVRCQSCGKIITTVEHYNAILSKLGVKKEDKILCPDCKQKHATDVFAL